MNIFDEARAIEGTIKMCEITQEELARKLDVSQSYIANKLRLLKFSEPVKQQITANGLSERHARTILRLGTAEEQLHAVECVAKQNLTVETTEKLVDLMVAQASGSNRRQLLSQTIGLVTEIMSECIATLARASIHASRLTEEDENGIRIVLTIREQTDRIEA